MHKNHFCSENKNTYRGIAPFVPNDPSHKEFYEVGLNFSEVSEKESNFLIHEETPFPECD